MTKIHKFPETAFVSEKFHWNIQDCKFVCGSLWVWNIVSDIRGGGGQRLRAFQNRVLRKIFGSRWGDRRLEKAV
jgi:hypothetical protein